MDLSLLEVVAKALPCTALVWMVTITFLLYFAHLLLKQAHSQAGKSKATLSSGQDTSLPRQALTTTSKDSTLDFQRLDSAAKEACSLAMQTRSFPDRAAMCLDLVHKYNLDVNSPVLPNGLTIFLCSCLSGDPCSAPRCPALPHRGDSHG